MSASRMHQRLLETVFRNTYIGFMSTVVEIVREMNKTDSNILATSGFPTTVRTLMYTF